MFFFYWYGDHRDLHLLTHSFPTRRSSDLASSWPRCSCWPPASPLRPSSSSATRRPTSRRRSRTSRGRRSRTRAPLRSTRSEEHTSELQSLMRISYAVFCLKKKKNNQHKN